MEKRRGGRRSTCLYRTPSGVFCDRNKDLRCVMSGMLMSSVADVALVWDQELFLYAIGLFCGAHVLYTAAFYQFYKGSYYSRIIFPINLIICVALVYMMEDNIPVVVVIIYGLFITTMAFFALSRLEMTRTAPAYLGWAGVKLFLLSDVMLAINELIPQLERPVSDSVVVMTYYLAQMGIGLSVFSC